MKFFPLATVLSACLCIASTEACTDFLIVADDQAAINGRSMEFAPFLNSKFIVHPRGEERQSKAPDYQLGLKWTSQYGYIGVTAFDLDCAIDGLNEKGLSFGALWLPGTQYEQIRPQNHSKALVVEQIGDWILGSFATVAEVKKALVTIEVWAAPIMQIAGIPPLHFAVHDATGESLVIEFINGKKKIYDNRIHVLTNAPQFDWHVLNLGNYLNLKAMGAHAIDLEGTVLSTHGNGSGLLGIPGDWMPSSRFVRMTAFKEFAKKPKDAAAGTSLAFHLLNTVDIPFGVVGATEKDSVQFDYTQWAVVKDLKNLKFYYRTYEDLNIRSIDLAKQDLQKGAPVQVIPMK